MVIIQKGYGEKPINIKVCNSSVDTKLAEFWIEFGCLPRQESLSYITLDELLSLRNEINKVIKDICGI